MKKSIIFVFFCFAIAVGAQSPIDRLVNQIEGNNPTLAVLRQALEAENTGTRTGLFPTDPEVELGFLNGKPDDLGRKTNFSIQQSFDFPLAYLQRGRLASNQRARLDRQFQLKRRDLLLEARLLAIDLVHTNALIRERDTQLSLTRELAVAYQASFEQGEANILEYNKARITELENEKELERAQIERKSLLAELVRLNGGQPVELNDDRFEPSPMMEAFDSWYRRIEPKIAELQILKIEREGLERQIDLDRALYLPKITLGYMSEKVIGEQFSGFTAGFSIPLFERKNQVTLSKKRAEAGRSLEESEKNQVRARLESLYEKSMALEKSASDYRRRLREYDTSPLLKKALQNGEISIIEYVTEISVIFDNRIRLLEMERDLRQCTARLLGYGS